MKRRLKRSRIFLKKEINPQMALREMTRADLVQRSKTLRSSMMRSLLKSF